MVRMCLRLKNTKDKIMERKKILEEIEELLDTESLSEEQVLENVDEYDSMGILILMEWYDSRGVSLHPEDFFDFNTVSDLIDRATT